MMVSHTVTDRSLAILSHLHQSFKGDGVATSVIVVTLDRQIDSYVDTSY